MPIATAPDPMDRPEPGWKYVPGAFEREMQETTRQVIENPGPSFTQAQIMADVVTEWKARITEFHVGKNSRMVDWLLDHPPANDLPPDLLTITQQYAPKTHPMEVIE